MMPVAEALDRLLSLTRPVGTEIVSLSEADGRVLRAPLTAKRTQPPFAASAMDGYAVRAEDARAGATLRVTAEIPAGALASAALRPGETMRIFTGAPLPEGADAILLQEDAERSGETVTVGETVETGAWVRPAGGDFRDGATLVDPGRRLRPQDVALAAAAGLPWLTVARKPRVSLIATGDELRLPGEPTGPSEIVSSNNFGVAALLARHGAEPVCHPIVRDDVDALRAAIRAARASDLIVTLGGASVGDHDFSRDAFEAEGMTPDFYKIAMRPGKPLMAGRLGDALVVGLPGNPVSAMVCAHIFLRPALDALLGLPAGPLPRTGRKLAIELPESGPREQYMRASLDAEGRVRPAENQDSSLLSVLAAADVLMVRPARDGARAAGDTIECIDL